MAVAEGQKAYWSSPLFCRDYEGNPVFKYGQVDELRLLVRVRNRGEDAHETILTVELPESVKYTNTDPAEVSILSYDDSGAPHVIIRLHQKIVVS